MSEPDLPPTAEKNHRAVVDLLMQHGRDISSAHAGYGNTPLFLLCGFPPLP